MSRILSERDFYKYISKDYKPTSYEIFRSEDVRFPASIRYSDVFRTRCYLIYRYISLLMSSSPSHPIKLLDMGFYPGNLIRILKNLLGEKILCYGVGLKLDESFLKIMGKDLEDSEYLDFDVFYRKADAVAKSKFDDHSFDVLVASEILEHLISPLELIEQGARLLRPGGHFIITTPNVSHIGAVIKLIFGRSNYERLHRSPMYLQKDEWRGHIRFYDKKELRILFEKYGLELIHHQYYTEKGWDHSIKSIPQQMAYIIKKFFWMIPSYREGHFAVFRKSII